MAQPKRIQQLVDAKNPGKKTGEGFYKWVDGRPQKCVAMPSDLQPLWMRMTLLL